MPDALTLTQPLRGCAVTAQGTPDMSVAVAAGSVLVANAAVTVAAGDVTITAADATQDRHDAVVVDATGAVSVIAGPVVDGMDVRQPDTSGYAVLAYVYVINQADYTYTGTITAEVITDAREFALIHHSPYRVSGQWYGIVCVNNKSSAIAVDNYLWLLPFFTGRALDVQAIGVNVSGAGTAGSKGRLGIYADDGSGGLSLLVDAGQVALDSGPSSPSLSISETLTPGWWWLAIAFQSLGVTKPTMYTVEPTSGVSPIGAPTLADAANRYGLIRYTGVSGALPDPPVSPTFNEPTAPGVWVQAA